MVKSFYEFHEKCPKILVSMYLSLFHVWIKERTLGRVVQILLKSLLLRQMTIWFNNLGWSFPAPVVHCEFSMILAIIMHENNQIKVRVALEEKQLGRPPCTLLLRRSPRVHIHWWTPSKWDAFPSTLEALAAHCNWCMRFQCLV